MGYISSNANRFYVALESSYGQVGAITASHRIPAVKLVTKQELVKAERRDKSGSRTFTGTPVGSRRETSFELTTYLSGWGDQTQGPAYGGLFQAGLGGAPLIYGGGVAGAGSTSSTLVFANPHGLAPGQAVSCEGEIRFASAIPDAYRVQLNAALSVVPMQGTPLGAAATYTPTTELPSVSIFDYWSPETAVQRVLGGAGVDKMRIEVNGDFHEFTFSGMAQDLIDSCSFESGLGALSSYPPEPGLGMFDYSIIPGHLGQAWLGNGPDRFYTITSATFTLDNDLEMRAKEFGCSVPRSIVPGRRSVTLDLELYEQDDQASIGLYQAARQQSPIGIMFQLGQQSGQLFGVYLKSLVPQVPEFDDSDRRLRWRFRNSRAQGTVDDEIAVAFG